MNNIYVYQYSNGTQFTTTANPMMLLVYLDFKKENEMPRAIGMWKYKEIHNKKNETKNN